MARIDLEFPWSNDWKYGYFYPVRKNRRAEVTLYRKKNDTTIVQYAKYRICVLLGRYLSEDEEVDHIDGNFLNDKDENLQVLTIEDHRKKNAEENKQRAKPDKLFVCDFCGIEFYLSPRQSHKKGKTRCCSRSCSVKQQHKNRKLSG